MIGKFYGGTSGLQISIPKRDFPPEYADKSRLAFYTIHHNSIEINSSFYNLPQAKTLARWVTEVDENFRFTFKLWQGITHQKNLLFKEEDVARFMEAIQILATSRGCLLLQFPPGLTVAALPQLIRLIQLLNHYNWKIAIEFRNNSWYNDNVYQLLTDHQIAMVIQDMPKSATPMIITSDEVVYLRFHGPTGDYKGSYNDGFLYEYALYIQEWQQEGKSVYCYFNNTAGNALNNLDFLKRCLD